MRLRLAASAALVWAAALCAIVAVASPQGALAGGAIDVRVLAVLAAVTVALTLALARSALPPLLGYVAAHLIGVALIAVLVEWPRPPWAWQALPGLSAAWTGGHLQANSTTLSLLALGLAWELSYACAWLALRERRVWLALGLSGATVVLAGSTQARDVALLALCALGLALALVGASLERRLALPRLVTPGGAMRWSPLLPVLVSGVLIAGAWAVPPAPAIPMRGWRAPDLSGAVSGLLSRLGLHSGRAGEGDANLGAFGADLRVGGRFGPSGVPLFVARLANPALSPYWRGAVYDTYTHGIWQALPARLVHEEAGAALPTPDGATEVAPVTETISLLRPTGALVTAGQPWRLSLPSTAALAGVPGAGVLSLRPAQGRVEGAYAAVSLPAPTGPVSPTPALSPDLRARDLTLPALPARVRDLALRLVAGGSDEYARAWSIQEYLRAAHGLYRYDTAPPDVPAGRDPVDYFLFDSRRGFCTQFASAMAVLARSAGIPARLVTGYAAGHLTRGQFVVTDADAHAWPELWIDGRGWVTFEPTPNFPTPWQIGPAPAITPIALPPTPRATATPHATATTPAPTRPPGATATVTATRRAVQVTPTVRPVAPAGRGGAGPRWPGLPSGAPWLGVALLAVALLAGIVWLVRRASPDAVTLYARMSRLAGLLRAGPRPGQTPLEWAGLLAARSPGDGAAVMGLTALYLRQRYGRQQLAREELVAARRSWRALRWRWLRLLLTRRRLAPVRGGRGTTR